MRSFFEREVWGSNLWPVESDTQLQTVCYHCDFSLKEAVLPEGNDAKMDPKTRYTFQRNTASIMKDLI